MKVRVAFDQRVLRWEWRCPKCGSFRRDFRWRHVRAINAAMMHYDHCIATERQKFLKGLR